MTAETVYAMDSDARLLAVISLAVIVGLLCLIASTGPDFTSAQVLEWWW